MPETMTAMRMHRAGQPLRREIIARPEPTESEVLVRVRACGVCRTDLHVFDGDLQDPKLPLILGHEVVGEVVEAGIATESFAPGQRVGMPWLGQTCGICPDCRAGRENLCSNARFTGYQLDGGYAEYAKVDHRFCLPMDDSGPVENAAPLLCAGLIGYRSLKKAGDARRIGLYGFGAAAHIVAQVAVWEGREVFAFTRDGDTAAQDLAGKLGCIWTGSSTEAPPEPLDAAILFAPVGALVPVALRAVRPGGRVVCAGIHMSDIPSFPYEILWMEREIVSVANLTRADGLEFLELAPRIPVQTSITPYRLEEANRALEDLRAGNFSGAAVLKMD